MEKIRIHIPPKSPKPSDPSEASSLSSGVSPGPVELNSAPTVVPEVDLSSAPTIVPEVDLGSAPTIVPEVDPSNAPTIVPEGFVRGGGIQKAWETVAPLKGAYRLVREIARGGMGKIFSGDDPQLEREVAVKVSSLSDGGEDARFDKEAKVLAQLAHPNIVPIHAMGVDTEGRPYYSMKLVKGRTLQAILKALSQKDPEALRDYPLPTLLTIFRKVCDAMAFAHSKRILHRDLKPENIMVGEYGEVLVMDWGLAKTLGTAEERTGQMHHPATESSPHADMGLTMEGDVMGTPQYMSPEQAEGMVAELDERSDVYSLGGILYAVLTLRPPIEGKTVNEVLSKVKSGKISSMTTTRGEAAQVEVGIPAPMERHVPEALRAVTLKAMSLDRARRYGSVEEFAAELEAYQNGFATKAEHAGALRQLVLLIKRNKAVSGLVALLMVAACWFVVRLGIEKEQARASESRALESEQQARASEGRALASEQQARASESRALASEQQARVSEQRALASEQDARASEQKALANEQKALAASEVARREAALAMIAVAEAAEEVDDSERMRSALAKVPEDLRDQTWRYLDHKSDSADLKIAPPNDIDWLEVDPLPDKPDTLLASQINGQFSLVDSSSGTVTPLWKAQRNGFWLFTTGLSAEGSRVALVWVKENLFEVEVRNLETGAPEGSPTVASVQQTGDGYRGAVVRFSGETLIFWTHSSEDSSGLEAWDIATGKRLWEKSGVGAFNLSADRQSVLAITKGLFEQYDVRLGDLQFQGSEKLPWPDVGSPCNTFLEPSGAGVLCSRSHGDSGVRRLDLQTGRLNWEAQREFGTSVSIQTNPSDQTVARVVARSSQGAVLELRSKRTGRLLGSYPFVGMVYLKRQGDKRIAASPNAFAVVLKKRLLVWRSAQNIPVTTRKIGDARHTGISEDGNWVVGSSSPEGKSVLELSDPTQTSGAPIDSVMLSGYRRNRTPQLLLGSSMRIVVSAEGILGAYQVMGDRIQEIWSPRRTDYNSAVLAIHPREDRLWIGPKIVEFSTGRELVALQRLGSGPKSLTAGVARSGAWVGGDRVVAHVDMSSEGSSGGVQRVLALWNAQTGEVEARSMAPNISALRVSFDSKWIAEGGRDKRIRLRSAETLAVEKEMRCHDAEIGGIAWHPRLPLLATSSLDGVVRIWDTQSWEQVEELRTEPSQRVYVDIASDGKRLVVTSDVAVQFFAPESFAK